MTAWNLRLRIHVCKSNKKTPPFNRDVTSPSVYVCAGRTSTLEVRIPQPQFQQFYGPMVHGFWTLKREYSFKSGSPEKHHLISSAGKWLRVWTFIVESYILLFDPPSCNNTVPSQETRMIDRTMNTVQLRPQMWCSFLLNLKWAKIRSCRLKLVIVTE